MYNGGIELPRVSFSTIQYSKIEIGSYFVGFDLDNSGKLSKMDSTGVITVIEGAGGTSDLLRIDVVSFGVANGIPSNRIGGDQNGLYDTNNIKPLLWEVTNSMGAILVTDADFSNILDQSQFFEALDEYCVNQGLDITVRGYYYIDQSKEKFRLVGKNAAYWSLVGLSNYGRLGDGRLITPGTIGQSIIDGLIANGLPIGSNGEGLIFTSQKGSTFGRPMISAPGIYGKISSQYYGITSGGALIPLSSQSGIEMYPNNLSYNRYVQCDRSGVYMIFSDYNSIETRPTSLVEFVYHTIRTNDYPTTPFLKGWLARPVGHDTILLSNNKDIENDDEIFVIPEGKFEIPYPSKMSVYSQIDEMGLGEDLITNDLKTSKDRFGNIRAEEIPCKPNIIRNKKNELKYRVAYGKAGIYTVSDDYITLFGNGRYLYSIVNRGR